MYRVEGWYPIKFFISVPGESLVQGISKNDRNRSIDDNFSNEHSFFRVIHLLSTSPSGYICLAQLVSHVVTLSNLLSARSRDGPCAHGKL